MVINLMEPFLSLMQFLEKQSACYLLMTTEVILELNAHFSVMRSISYQPIILFECLISSLVNC